MTGFQSRAGGQDLLEDEALNWTLKNSKGLERKEGHPGWARE